LFGDLPKEPAKEPAMPVEPAPAAAPEPAPAPPAEPKAEPAKTNLDDLFSPAAKPEPAPAAEPKAEPAKTNLDDLFGPPAAKPEAAPKAKPQADDPFSSLQREPVELSMRTWVDNTGKYRVTAKLVAILDGQVRLLKDSGKTTTVDMNRLSQADQQYVQVLAGQFGSATIGQIAAR